MDQLRVAITNTPQKPTQRPSLADCHTATAKITHRAFHANVISGSSRTLATTGAAAATNRYHPDPDDRPPPAARANV